MARIHHRVGVCERVPGLVVAAEIFEFLVARELDRGMLFAAVRDSPDAAREIIQMIALGRLLAQARELERRARRCVGHAQAGVELGLGLLHATVEDELHAARKTEFSAVRTGGLGAIEQCQRFGVLGELVAEARGARERLDFARALERRVVERLARRDGLAGLQQRGDDIADQELVVGQHFRRVERMARRVAHAVLLPGDAAEDQMHVDVLRRFLRERFERDARGGDLVLVEVALGPFPEPSARSVIRFEIGFG